MMNLIDCVSDLVFLGVVPLGVLVLRELRKIRLLLEWSEFREAMRWEERNQ